MRTRHALAGLAIIGLLTSGCGLTASDIPVPGGGIAGDTYELTTVFNDALNLPVKAKVKEGGVDIGRVQQMTVDGFNAKVELAIQVEHKIPRGSTFQLRQTSALGEVYVDVTPPERAKNGYLEDGDVIGTDQTGEAPGVEDTLAALSMVTNGGGVSQLTTIIRESEKALAGNTSDVSTLLDQVGLVVAALDRRTGSVNEILESAARLSAKVNRRRSTVQAVFDDIAPAASVLSRQTRQLVRLLTHLDQLSRSGSDAITTVRADVLRLMGALGPALDGFLALDGDLRQQFTNMLEFSDRVMRFLPGDSAVGTLQIMGILGNGAPAEGSPRSDKPPYDQPIGSDPPLSTPDLSELEDLMGLDDLLSPLLPQTAGDTS